MVDGGDDAAFGDGRLPTMMDAPLPTGRYNAVADGDVHVGQNDIRGSGQNRNRQPRLYAG